MKFPNVNFENGYQSNDVHKETLEEKGFNKSEWVRGRISKNTNLGNDIVHEIFMAR